MSFTALEALWILCPGHRFLKAAATQKNHKGAGLLPSLSWLLWRPVLVSHVPRQEGNIPKLVSHYFPFPYFKWSCHFMVPVVYIHHLVHLYILSLSLQVPSPCRLCWIKFLVVHRFLSTLYVFSGFVQLLNCAQLCTHGLWHARLVYLLILNSWLTLR